MIGAQLQEINTHSWGLVFDFYKKGNFCWALDLTPQIPLSFLLSDQHQLKNKTAAKPVALFLRSHGKNLYLSKVQLKKEAGRIIEVELMNSQKICQMEIHLIPKAPNLIVRTEDKSISWQKPKDLGPPPQMESELDRDLEQMKSQWLEDHEAEPGRASQIAVGGVEDWEKQKQKKIQKKKKALTELTQQLSDATSQKWQDLGELLKSFEISELGSEWRPYLTKGVGRYEQMNLAFAKAKQLEGKKKGTQDRISILEKEIRDLEQTTAPPARTERNRSSEMMKSAGAFGRIRKFGDLTASKGKSAEDNLALLRKARGWDLWVHLRDYPGAHGILSVEKNQKVPDSTLREVALWVASETKSAQKLPSGSKLDILVAECRFVRPIKGDKLGRVHYQNERVFTVVIP